MPETVFAGSLVLYKHQTGAVTSASVPEGQTSHNSAIGNFMQHGEAQ